MACVGFNVAFLTPRSHSLQGDFGISARAVEFFTLVFFNVYSPSFVLYSCFCAGSSQ